MNKLEDYQRRINAAVNQVASNLDRNHTLEELAAHANFSKYHFHRLYRALCGESVAAMVLRLRLERAAGALVYSKDRSITDLALTYGFSSGANFTKAFTKHFGCPPSAYRKKSKIGKVTNPAKAYYDDVAAEVTIGVQPERQLAYVRSTGGYVANEIRAMHQQVQTWVVRNDCGATESASIGITWSDSLITDEERWRYDACVAVQSGTQGAGAIGIQTLRGGRTAQLGLLLGPQDNHDLSRYWDWLVRDWFMNSAHELGSQPSYERYESTEQGLRVWLCLPLNET